MLYQLSFILTSILFAATNGIKESQLYFTRFGNIIGMDVHFRDKNLRSVDIICGFPYASIRRHMLRFMPPVKSLEKWLGNRSFSNVSFHGVCPQGEFGGFSNWNPYKSHTVAQNEDCLSLNLFVPIFKGKA